MDKKTKSQIFDLPELRNRTHVFSDRKAAGKVLASMLGSYRESDAIVLAIPAGGLAVAVGTAKELNLALDVAIISKITLPWNTEAGFRSGCFRRHGHAERRTLASPPFDVRGNPARNKQDGGKGLSAYQETTRRSPHA